MLAADAALTAAGGVGGLVVGAGRGAALGAEPERRPRGVPHAPLLHRAPCPMSSRAEMEVKLNNNINGLKIWSGKSFTKTWLCTT